MFPNLLGLYRGLRYLYSQDSYLIKTGFTRCLIEDRPVNAKGESIAWLNYALLNFLVPRLSPTIRMYEYGCGYSTRFFSKYVKTIHSLEDNAEWFKFATTNKPENATITLQPDVDKYPSMILSEEGTFDLILVDGIVRNDCVREAIQKLSPAGVLILDDTHRDVEFTPAFNCLKEHGFRYIPFQSPKPLGQWVNESRVFYRDGNCLGI